MPNGKYMGKYKILLFLFLISLKDNWLLKGKIVQCICRVKNICITKMNNNTQKTGGRKWNVLYILMYVLFDKLFDT